MSKIAVQIVESFKLVWRDRGSRAKIDGAFYQPLPPSGYRPLGYYAQANYGSPFPDINVIGVKENEEGGMLWPNPWIMKRFGGIVVREHGMM